ncbi:Aldehyde-alcohol dehydrogenase [Planctomycetes bacterium Poly30]|uniref:Aldehyde-alcohol dehydrogenase n=1 Tax=Saltatorellus ferox TaxID=2528018 RepID=A0A518EQZ8_9BACT|nr:Aldehyde-alcohol dehydrogenase [Planctomycetes bacterium Poly30]
MKGLDPDLRALQEVRDAVRRAKEAQTIAASWSQEQTDRVCEAMSKAAAAASHDLARLAVEETGIGRVHYKILKNLFGSEGVWDSIKNERTVGFVSRDERAGVHEVASPVGVVAGIVPTTNPTSTTMYKALISVKGRNSVVISPHPRAKRCIGETVEVMRRAIERAGGPPDLVVCLANPTIESTGALMKHRDVAVILSTGGSGLVRAAYSSGKPAYGVGPGNVPCYVDRSANLGAAAEAVVASQSFDNATLCCSEQALVLDRPVAQRFLAEMQMRGAHVANEAERKKLETFCNQGGHMNPDIVGIDPWRIAEMAGFHVPQSTTVLLAFQDGVGKAHPLSIEILCPLLSIHVIDGWEQGCAVSKELLHFGGLGHTLSVHAEDRAILDAFFLAKPASRIVVNGPSSMGAVGFSTNLVPSFSLGCGPQAGNITSDNISARHLVNLKRVAFPTGDWKERERRAHERAAAMTGAGMPRGSMMDGDPGFRRGAEVSAVELPKAASSMPAPKMSSPPPPAPVVRARPVQTGPLSGPLSGPRDIPIGLGPSLAPGGSPLSGGAPRFTRPASGAPPAHIPVAPARSAPMRAGAEPSAGPSSFGAEQGISLSSIEIEAMLKNAGAGCPMGPCGGCPHHDATHHTCGA